MGTITHTTVAVGTNAGNGEIAKSQWNEAHTITGALAETVYTITDAAAFEIDPDNGGLQNVTLGASRTPKGTNFGAGESMTLRIKDGAAFTLTWTDTTFGASGVNWVGGSAPTLDTTDWTVVVLWKEGSQVYGKYIGVVA